MKTLHFVLVSVLVLVGLPAHAQQTPTGETTKLRVTNSQVDYGNLHIMADLLGYQLIKAGDGAVSVLQGVYQFGDRLAVRGTATLPLLGAIGWGSVPVRVEAVGLLFAKVETVQEKEDVPVGGGQAIVVPVLNKIHSGFAGGLQYRTDFAKFPPKVLPQSASATYEAESGGNALTAVLGYEIIQSAGMAGETEKYGKFQHNRWLHGGLDMFIDLTHSYDVEPKDKQGRFGGRLWMESMFGTSACLTGRLDIGYLPGGTGWNLLAAIGGGLHLFVP